MQNKFYYKIGLLVLSVITMFIFSACGTEPGTEPGQQGGLAPGGGSGAQAQQGGHIQPGDRVVQGSLPDPATFIAHQHSSAGTGEMGEFAFEGLIRFQRGTDDIMMVLAESYEHTENQTIFTIRENARWNDGEPFTARDVWAFYAITGNAPAGWIYSVDIIDDLTVGFTFREPVPVEEMRLMLIAEEVHHGRIPYHVYSEFAYQLYDIWQQMPFLTQEQIDAGIRGPFGRDTSADPDLVAARDEIFREFAETPPNAEHIILGTGPYMNVPGHTMNEGILIQNPYYWNPAIQTWNRIVLRAVTDATRVNMMQNEDIHWMDGTLPLDMTNTLLASNENLVYFPMRDPASHGLIFNQQSENAPMDRIEFRQALNFVANREALRDIGSYQSDIHTFSLAGIPPSLLEMYVRPDVANSMREYYHNLEKAEELMESIGATRGANNNWLDANGNAITLRIGVDQGWHISTLVTPIYAAQLTAFGIPTEVMAVEGAVFGPQAEEGEFDMAWDWIDIAWNFSHPFFTLSHTFNSGVGRRMQLEIDELTNLPVFSMTDWNGESFDVWSLVQSIPFLPPEEAQPIWERVIWATNEYALGINFYQNVTGSWENLAHVNGLPMLDQMPENRWMPFADTGAREDLMSVHNLNVGHSSNVRKLHMIYAVPWDDAAE